MEDYIMTPMRTQAWLPSIFNDLFNDEWLSQRPRQGATPAVNIIENEKDYRIELAAPGMGREDLNVSIDEDNNLVIAFEKHCGNDPKDGKCQKEEKNEKKDTYLRREFSYSSFRQSFLLPDDVDKEKIGASMKHGVLTVDLPKKDLTKEVPVTKQIEIK